MKRCKLDALLTTSSISTTYFTGYYSWLSDQFKEFMVKPGGTGDLLPTFALFPASGTPALIIDATVACNAMHLEGIDLCFFGGAILDVSTAPGSLIGRERKLYEDAIAFCPETPVETLAEYLSKEGLSEGRIGIEMDGLAGQVLTSVEEALPRAKLLDCSNLIRLVRAVKTPEEIERLRRATRIAEDAAVTSLREVKAGRAIRDVSRHFLAELAAQGAELDHFAYSVKGLGIATEGDYTLAEDDVLYVDYGCVSEYYCSDSGFTLAMKPLSGDFERKYRALRDCILAGSEALRPGTRASAVPDAMWKVLRAHNVEVSFPHGHGIGLEVRDYPILVPSTGLNVRDDCIDEPADLVIEKNMVLNLEAPIFLPGSASLHIEQTFVVGPQGAEPLTPQNRDTAFVP